MTKTKKKKKDTTCWYGCGERGTLNSLLVEVKTGAAPVETSVVVPQKARNRLIHDTVVSLVVIHPRDSISYYRELCPCSLPFYLWELGIYGS